MNVSSRGALFPGPGPYENPRAGGWLYGMLKAALERFSQGIAMDLQADGIAVNVLSPQGFIRTPGGIFGQNDREHPNLDFEPAHAMGKAAAWLCQQPATYTGHILYDEEVCKAQGV